MPEAFAASAAAAARMLLAPPDAALLGALAPAADEPLEIERARQDFYDFLCVPQSGCYIPPYAHVLARGERTAELWHFPPPRFDGGDALRPWYEAARFEPARLKADPLIAGPNRPFDHAGFVLAFLAALLSAAADEPAGAAVVSDFLAEHGGAWIDLFAELLGLSESPYITLLGQGLAELVADLRAAFPPQREVRVVPAEAAVS
jgi:Nitrate reductase delta subunit